MKAESKSSDIPGIPGLAAALAAKADGAATTAELASKADGAATTAALAAKAALAGADFTGAVNLGNGTAFAALLGSNNVYCLAVAGVWNDAGKPFKALGVNVTDTASPSSSLLLDLAVGGTSKFKVEKSGKVVTPHYVHAFGIVAGYLNDPTNAVTHLNLSHASNLLVSSALVQFVGTGSGNPALKAVGAVLQARLANDSAFATLRAKLHLETAAAPASATDTGVTGETRWDADYFYLCTAANTWVRAALASW